MSADADKLLPGALEGFCFILNESEQGICASCPKPAPPFICALHTAPVADRKRSGYLDPLLELRMVERLIIQGEIA